MRLWHRADRGSATMKAHFARAVRYGGVLRPRDLDHLASGHDSRQSTLCTDSFESRKLIALAVLQHGVPKKKLSCGVTHLDKETFLEYIENLRETYRAEAYHLLEFNCEPHVFLSPALVYDTNTRMSRQATPLRTTCSVSLTAARFRRVFRICSEPAGSARLISSLVRHRHPKSANRAHVDAVRPADATDDRANVCRAKNAIGWSDRQQHHATAWTRAVVTPRRRRTDSAVGRLEPSDLHLGRVHADTTWLFPGRRRHVHLTDVPALQRDQASL